MGASKPVKPRIELDPRDALGWRDIPLDGLNCYLRSVEAILRSHGHRRDDVLAAMSGPVTDDMPADGSPWFRLNGSRAQLTAALDGGSLWPSIESDLRAGTPVIVFPDYYYWPGSRFRHRRHVHDHAILLTEIRGNSVEYLDIDAERRDGFRASVSVDDDVAQAFRRVLAVEPAPPAPRQSPDELRRIVAASVAPLTRWVQGVRALAAWWRDDAYPGLAHAVEWWIFSDLQSQLFLMAEQCAEIDDGRLVPAARAATTQAQKAGLFLIAMNEYKSEAPYRLAGDDIALLGDRLATLAYAAAEYVAGTVEFGADRNGEKLWRRLDALSRWHVGIQLRPLQEPALG